MTNTRLSVDPDELISAATDLDRIADQLEGSLTLAGRSLTVAPQGRDEVSVAAAASFNTVSVSAGNDAATGVHELRKVAAVLRAHAHGLVDADNTAATLLKT